MPGNVDYSPSKREFELALKKSAGGWVGKMSDEEKEELRKLKEKNALKRRASSLSESDEA